MKRNNELKLPDTFTYVTDEEVEFVDGSGFWSKLKNIVCIAGAVVVFAATTLLSSCAGPGMALLGTLGVQALYSTTTGITSMQAQKEAANAQKNAKVAITCNCAM